MAELTHTRPSPRHRWFICALLFAATTINYVDRQILALVKPILDEQLHWNNEAFGTVNAAFQLAYGIGLLGFGWFIDRRGVKVGYAVSIAAWSSAALGHAAAFATSGFVIARMALGFGEGGNFPAAIKVVSLWFSEKERALATTLFNSGANIGAVIAPAIVPWLAYTWGWRSAFLVPGAAGFVWLFVWLRYYGNPPAGAPSRVAATSEAPDHTAESEFDGHATSGWLSLFRLRRTWAFVIAKFITDPVWGFFLIWLPDYFKQTRGLDIRNSWPHLMTIYGIVTILSIGGGWWTAHLAQRGWSVAHARKRVMFVCALCVLPVLVATQVGDWTAVLLIGVAGAAHQAWSASLFSTVAEFFPRSAVASVVGIGSVAGAAGNVLFPIFTGILLDRAVAAHQPTAGYATLFMLCAVAYLIAFFIYNLFTPMTDKLPSKR